MSTKAPELPWDSMKALASGLFAFLVGLVIAALVLIPLWAVALFASDYGRGYAEATLFTLGWGLAYAFLFGLVTAVGLPRRWTWALLLSAAGGLGGALSAPPTGASPAVYAAACTFLGLALWLAGALQVGRKVPRPII